MRTIWIINHYATTEYDWQSGRPYCFAKYLSQMGHNVVVFCASSIHSTGEQYIDLENNLFKSIVSECGATFVFVKARSYKKSKRKRVQNITDFYINVRKTCKLFASSYGKPDVVIGSSAHLLNCVAAIKLAKVFNCKSIVEIRDLWPESFVLYGLLKSYNPVVLILRRIEKWCYLKANKIIFTMENAYQYIIDRKWAKCIPLSKIVYINNGVDLDVFNFNKSNYTINDTDLNNPDLFKVVYTGTISKVNGVHILLDAASLINNPSVKILVWGYGTEFETLNESIKKSGIKNIVLKGQIKKEYIPFIISHSNLNLVHNTETNIFKYGLSLNKMFEYTAAGKPILFDFGSNNNPLKKYNAAIFTKNNTAEGIAKGITDAFNLTDKEKEQLNVSMLTCAKAYDYKSLTKKLIDTIETLF